MEISEKDRLDDMTRRIIGAAQLLSYLRLAGKREGLLINFHVAVLKNGVKRIVNEFPDDQAISAVSASRR